MTIAGSSPFDLSDETFNAIASPVFILDHLLRVVHWNHAIAAMTAITSDQIRGLSFAEAVLFPEDAANWTSEMNRIYAEFPRIKVNNRWQAGGAADVTSVCVLVSTESAKHIVCTVENPWPTLERASASVEFLHDRSAEMREISRFLHDTVSQDLVQLSFFVGKIHSEAHRVPGLTETGSAVELVDRCCRDIRILSCIVAPLSLDGVSLHEAIEQFVGHFREVSRRFHHARSGPASRSPAA